jgi:hypothetical protein
MSWSARLKEAQEAHAEKAASAIEPWRLRLERVHGKVDFDGLERVSSQTLMDLLEIPQRHRRAGAYRRLARVMTELGWRATRVRDLNGRGFKEQLRGFCRDARQDNRFTEPGRNRVGLQA